MTTAPAPVPAARLDRTTGGLLAGGIALAWLLAVFGPAGMHAGPVVFVFAWTIMMTAMMLPSAAPLVLLFRRGATLRATLTLIAGYLAVWAATGVPAYFAGMHLPMSVAPLALAAAGVYQLTPIKQICLRRCRAPADFLMQHWGRSPLRIGAAHGAWCVGCCWALMLVLVLAGSMGLAWVVGIAAIVAMEKLSAHGALLSRAVGVAFLVAALLHGGMPWHGS